MVEFFQTNKGMDLERLTTATLMKLEEIKERTATGKIVNLCEGEPLEWLPKHLAYVLINDK